MRTCSKVMSEPGSTRSVWRTRNFAFRFGEDAQRRRVSVPSPQSLTIRHANPSKVATSIRSRSGPTTCDARSIKTKQAVQQFLLPEELYLVARCPGIPRPSTRSSSTGARDPGLRGEIPEHAGSRAGTADGHRQDTPGSGHRCVGASQDRRSGHLRHPNEAAWAAGGRNGAAGRCHSTLFMLAQVRTDGLARSGLHPCWFLAGAVMPRPAAARSGRSTCRGSTCYVTGLKEDPYPRRPTPDCAA
jgi:hypothetical protein